MRIVVMTFIGVTVVLVLLKAAYFVKDVDKLAMP